MTDGIIEELDEWQHRPLDAVYPILYIDALVVKVRTNGTVVKRTPRTPPRQGTHTDELLADAVPAGMWA